MAKVPKFSVGLGTFINITTHAVPHLPRRTVLICDISSAIFELFSKGQIFPLEDFPP
jgi:hypothetical protein